MSALLEVRGLRVRYGTRLVVDGADLEVGRGEIFGLVGESGCGKSTLALALLRLLPDEAGVEAERLALGGVDLRSLRGEELRRIRGAGLALVFQEPSASFNPVLTIGEQVGEPLRWHRGLSRKEALAGAVELLRRVGLPAPEARARAYPHELSGGMLQRALIAAALAGGPRLLVADEPTTALDVTVQAGILDLLRDLRDREGLAVLLITHDLGVLAQTVDRLGVMYAGRIVEEGPVGEVFARPLHPYTEALLASLPARAPRSARLPAIPGSVPAPGAWPGGCRFHPRCARAFERCAVEEPRTLAPGPGLRVACHLHEEGGA